MALNRNLRFAALAFFLWSLAYNLTAPVLPLFARELGASPAGIGAVGAATALGALVLILPLSWLADRAGQRNALLAGWTLSACGFALMWLAHSPAALLPGAFLSAGALAARPALNALAIIELPRAQLSRGFALVYAAAPLGALCGSALTGFLAERHGLRSTTILAAASVLVAALALLPLRGTHAGLGAPTVTVSSATNTDAHGAAAALAVLTLLAGGGFMLLALPGSFIVPYLRDVGHQTLVATGLLTALLSGAQLAWSLLFSVWPATPGRLSVLRMRRFSLPAATVQALSVCLAANALFGLLLPVRSNAATVAALMLRGSQYTLQSLGAALLGDALPAGPRLTTRLTLFSGILGLAAVVAPLAGGWLYSLMPACPFRVTGVAAAVGAVALSLYLLRARVLGDDSPEALAGATGGE